MNTPKSPNILWICSDQQRWDTLGCYGNEWVKTPNLDRLAEQGTIFDYAFSQSPVCTPSRACFLTGRYPRSCRTRQNGQEIPADEVLVTKMLADAGYICGLSGKLHLSPCSPQVCKTVERRIDDGYSVFHWSHHCFDDWGDHNEYNKWLREKGAKFETPRVAGSNYVDIGMPEELHQTTWCAEKAIDFMKARAEDGKPWLFSVNMFDPHHGFDPPESYLARYLDRLDDIPLPNYEEGELANKPRWQKIDHQGAYGNHSPLAWDKMMETDHRMLRAAYWAMCDLIDNQVGRMLKALEDTGQAENTIVIFMSDHGEMLGDHGIYLKGAYLYDCAIRVPLIISWPGHVQTGRSEAMVELVDLPQTLLDAVGMAPHPGMQGRSLWPLLTGEADRRTHRDDIYCEDYNCHAVYGKPTPQMTMVRTRTHKLSVNHTDSDGELYDLENDPRERVNRWDDPACAELKSKLLLRLCHRMAFTVDPLPERIAGW